jgi:general secretion pathway protein G
MMYGRASYPRERQMAGRRLRKPRHSRGFTLIEIMVVVVILGILAAIVVPNVFGNVDKARVAKAKQDIRSFETALSLYQMDNYKFPSGDQGLQALVNKPNDPNIRNYKPGGYLTGGVKKDPWGNDYKYVTPGTHGGEYDLFTLGADNQEGGDGNNADIGNWDTE